MNVQQRETKKNNIDQYLFLFITYGIVCSMMTKTAASVLQYLTEIKGGTFGEDPIAPAKHFVFGTEQSLTNWSNRQNQQSYVNPFSGTLSGFYYGNQDLGFTLEWIYADPIMFYYVLGKLNADTYTLEKGFIPCFDFTWVDNSGENNVIERYRSCIIENLSLSTSVGNKLSCKATVKSGIFTNNNADVSTTQPDPSPNKPYTFENAVIQLNSVTVAEIQNFTININTNGKLARGMGSKEPVSAYKNTLMINANMTVHYLGGANLDIIKARAETASMVLTLTNGTDVTTMTFGGVGMVERVVPKVAGAELIQETISMELRELTVT